MDEDFDEQDEESLPTPIEHPEKIAEDICKQEFDYTFEPFVPVQESTDDRKTTEADVSMLNNLLAVAHAQSYRVSSIAGLSVLSSTVCKLIETRRKVKKLAYGEQGAGKKSGLIVIE